MDSRSSESPRVVRGIGFVVCLCVAGFAAYAYAAAPVALSTTSLSFGTLAVGNTSSAKSVSLTNHKARSLNFSSITTTGDFAIAGNSCGASIAAGATCSISVTFSPTTLGTRRGTLTFTDNAASSPQTVSLSGTGSAPVTVSPLALSFASQLVGTTGAAQTVKLTNHLNSSLAVSTVAASGDFAVSSNACSTVGAGLTCSVGVTFKPTAVGTRTGTLTITYNAFGSPSVLSLTGIGAVAALASITVTPATPSIPPGNTQQFVATGTYMDGSTQNLTSSATWNSSVTTVATISTAGLASSVGTGSTIIMAISGSISGSTTLTVTPPQLTSIVVTPANATIPPGNTQQFAATGTYTDGSTQNLTSSVTWSSSVTTVATISIAGLASSGGAGSTTIKAVSGGASGSTTLTVTAAALVSISVTPANPSVPLGQTQQFTAIGALTNGGTQDLTSSVTWSSSGITVATISTTGIASTVSTGSAVIMASSGSISGSTTLTVTPPQLLSIAATPANVSIPPGNTQQFEATGTYTDGSTQNLTSLATWNSSATTVAIISAGGLATTLDVGTTTISASSGNVSGSATLASGAGPTWVQSDDQFSQAAAATAKQTDALTHTSTAGNALVVWVAAKTTTSTLTSVTASGCQFFIYTNQYLNGTSESLQEAIGLHCPATSSITVTMSAGTKFTTIVDEYAGVASVGQFNSATGTSTTPSVAITTQDANNLIIMGSASLGSNGVPTAGTGNLRQSIGTDTTATGVAGADCDNTAASAQTLVTCSDTITSGPWVAVAIELRSANPADPLLVDAVDTSCDCGPGQPAGNDWVVYFPQPVLSGNAMICGLIYDFSATRTLTITDSTGGSNTWSVAKTANGTNESASIVYSLNMAAGTAWAKFHFDTTLPNYQLQVACKETYHIAALDAGITSATSGSVTGPNVSAGSITPSQANDLVFGFVGIDVDASLVDVADGIQQSPAIAVGSGFSPVITDVVTGMCFEDLQQGSAMAVNPSCDVESTAKFNAVAAAFKTDGSGTAPPATGIHIDHEQAFVIYIPDETSRNIQIPADGNFIALSNTTSNGATYTIGDSHQNAYSQSLLQGASVNLFYPTNATVDSRQMVSISLAGAVAGYDWVVYDIRGVKTSSPIGCQTPVNGTASQGVFTAGATISNIPTITPCAAGDLMIWAMQNGCGPTQNLSGPSGAITDNVYYAGQTDGSRLNFGEGHGHYFTTGTSAVNFNAVMNNLACRPSNFYTYGVWEISLKQ